MKPRLWFADGLWWCGDCTRAPVSGITSQQAYERWQWWSNVQRWQGQLEPMESAR